jgi:hypothetical protein
MFISSSLLSLAHHGDAHNTRPQETALDTTTDPSDRSPAEWLRPWRSFPHFPPRSPVARALAKALPRRSVPELGTEPGFDTLALSRIERFRQTAADRLHADLNAQVCGSCAACGADDHKEQRVAHIRISPEGNDVTIDLLIYEQRKRRTFVRSRGLTKIRTTMSGRRYLARRGLIASGILNRCRVRSHASPSAATSTRTLRPPATATSAAQGTKTRTGWTISSVVAIE